MNPLTLLPELALALTALAFFALSLGETSGRTLHRLALLLPLACLAAALGAMGERGELFFDCYRLDGLSQLFKVIICGGLLLVLLATSGLSGIEGRLKPEYLFFISVGTLGLVLTVSSHELLTMLLSLELSSFALNVMIPLRSHAPGQRRQMEASIKYFLFGVMSSGLMLYGMGYLFGLAHSTHLTELGRVVPGLMLREPLALVAMLMLVAGFLFKLSLFPMHFLTPDLYQGAANETAAYAATLPKVAAACVLIRLLGLCGSDPGRLVPFLAICALLSLLVGNLSALVQEDLKRLLAYSSIAHAGYLTLGLLCADGSGFAAVTYYAVAYLLMNLACFFVIYRLAPRGVNVCFRHLEGLSRRSPLLAFTLASAAFGLTGIPPTAGFTGKFLIFTAAIRRGFHGLVILAVINAAISAYYYLKLVRAAYCVGDGGGEALALTPSARLVGLVLSGAIILLGLLPRGVLELAEAAVAGLG